MNCADALHMQVGAPKMIASISSSDSHWSFTRISTLRTPSTPATACACLAE
jgi:hypothetical protein